MRIKQLIFNDFGPFRRYKISFIEEEEACILLTGKNNEGKSSLINGMKLLNAATKVINKKKQEIIIDSEYYYKLLQLDTENILIGRIIHNYSNNVAVISGIFDDDFKLNVYLDPNNDIVYADFEGRIPKDILNIFGFIPPLGPLSENEDIITDKHLKASIDTSLAPRHLRNHFYQILTSEEFKLIRKIIKKSWPEIDLLDYFIDTQQNKIFCFYKEDRVDREISWAGQGLQVWFQIITHFVRLRNSSVLILDEPEINLHPEKQNSLIRILRDYYHGSIIIATHSIELMNNVNVSHIINIAKKHNEPKIKSTNDRVYLNLIRSQVGSNFNLIASQFEDFDLIVFTEDTFDFEILQQIGSAYKLKKKAFNIPIHGFSEFKKCIPYKHAYKILLGKTIDYTAVLDRDYYPEEYLIKVKHKLEKAGIRVIFTPGKEIENLFLSPEILASIIPKNSHNKFLTVWNQMFSNLRINCYASYQTLHENYLDKRLDIKTVTLKYTPIFEKCWEDPNNRHKIVEGKKALKVLRKFYRQETECNLSQSLLIETLIKTRNENVRQFIEEVFHQRVQSDQILHY